MPHSPAPAEDTALTDAVNGRLAVVADDGARALAVARGDIGPASEFVHRVTTRLYESRAMLTAHATRIADAIASTPEDQQPEKIAQLLRPVTLGIEQATLALARIRAAGGER